MSVKTDNSIAIQSLLNIYRGEITDEKEIRAICFAAASTIAYMVRTMAVIRADMDRKIDCLEQLTNVCEIVETCEQCPFENAEKFNPVFEILKDLI